ncbi:UbiA family prenyltransferase [Occallatibacter riparius]|uniref:UbiA family prenyltransferase n=1 Tax=Occallatibacter riparius TaxID=1002689 RepID=A0A9J7BND6_9BACT|nr:UbiA family prenyltransferase [Occallatibacter riparius]UWZ84025.1 UbiA family prenyltransferase [Occallatibacter riparius]
MPPTLGRTAAPVATLTPLCVDLDGTLVKSDTLHDSLLVLLRSHPSQALRLPAQVLKGKAAFKAFVTDSVSLDVAHLPYNRELLHYLQAERAKGREIYLATGADVRLAQRVADHLGIFTGVLGSDGTTNLTGKNKLDRLRSQFPDGVFDYIGNDTPDLPLLAHSEEPMVANPSLRLRLRMRASSVQPARRFDQRANPIRSFIKAIRVHQWAKNALIFFPLLLAHHLRPKPLSAAFLAFCSFSLVASATYIINDLLDIEADRRHRRKRMRPFAAGDLSLAQGVAIVITFLALAAVGTRFIAPEFSLWLLLYLVTTFAYTAWLKRIPLVDVLILSGLYTLRLLAGSAATSTPISHWLAGFSVFLFLSLGIVKRFAELENLRASSMEPSNGRGYFLNDMEQLRTFGTSSAYAAVVILAIYISGRDVTKLYHNPGYLWLVVPLMLLWLNRVWLLASRGELDEDPVVFAITDRMSLLIGAATALIVFLAS